MKAPDNVEVFDTTLTTCWFGTDGIVYSSSKVAERTIENYKHLFEIYKKLSDNGNNKFCIVGDITKTQPLRKEVRAYIDAELPKYVKAMALISDSPLGDTIGKLFIVLSTSPYPSRMFDDLDAAVNWLRKYL